VIFLDKAVSGQNLGQKGGDWPRFIDPRRMSYGCQQHVVARVLPGRFHWLIIRQS
jgi:hypothetical protein